MTALRIRVPLDARRVDAIECVVSVLLAIALAHWTGARNISWAAFSGYMVMRGHVSETMLRGLLRIVGTVTGAALALLLVPWTAHGPVAMSLLLALVTLPTLYAALTARRAYAWLFVALTFAMVVLDAAEHPGADVHALVATRVLEVAVGTLACVMVSLASTLTLRRWWPAAKAGRATRQPWHPDALRHAAQGTLAVALLPWIARAIDVPEIAQGAVTILAVMMVPLKGLEAGGLRLVSARLGQRVVGCVAGAGYAGVVLLLHVSAGVLLLAVAIGVAIGRMAENGWRARSYVGTQFVLAVLVTLVPDRVEDVAVAPALARLEGIAVGLAILEPVVVAWHLIARPRVSTAHGAVLSEPGGP
ncbi:FUSC family protein [Sphingomonas sp. Mn802worker]|uniref:FUSC family protein n=1 Tax=Sphingomonas sp. Mn802worker TaxID=629773 RepID=UPI000364D8B6|nr:FUSC family protein [Sphingomonas sp. Mn802worker]